MLAYIIANKVLILGFLFALSEAIGMLPGVQASGVFQAIFNGIKYLKNLVTPAAP